MTRSRPIVLVLLLALAVLAGAPALALAKDGDAAAEKINILEPRFDLTIWTIVVFALLFVVLRVFAWRPMLEGLHKREQAIQSAIDEAHRARAEAEEVRARLKTEMDKVHETVRLKMEEVHRAGENLKAQKLAEAEAAIHAERDRSLHEIRTAREQALQELWNQSAQLATLISAKAIRRSLNADDHRGLVDEAVAELKTAARKNV